MEPPASRPALAPGLRVVPRGRDRLQVGLYAERRALLPRDPTVESTLAGLLAREEIEDDPATREVLDRLDRAGCLTRAAPGWPASRQARVGLVGRVPGVETGDLVAAAGAVVTSPAACDVALVLCPGEVPRDWLDDLVRHGTAHVVLRLVDGAAVLGPFVVPGVTACVRCIDAERSVADPDHVAVTSRYARATSRTRGDGVPDVADPMLALLATAWVVRDAVAHHEGLRPTTWSRTLVLGAVPAHREEQEWRRHPECGCSWPAPAQSSGTMGA